jgi:signal transduction histidine kinase
MFSVRLSDLRRTTSFRLALLFLGLIGTGSLIVFGFLYFETSGFLARDVDAWLAREISTRVGKSAAELARLIDDRAPLDPEGRRPFALFDSGGDWIAGSRIALPRPLPALDRPFDFTLPSDDSVVPYHGMLHRLSTGELFLAAEDMRQIYWFRRLLAAAMVSGGVVMLAIGLAGGMIAGSLALGRIDAVALAIERIVNGDFSERLPEGGTQGDLDRLIRVVNRMLDDIERLMQEVKGVTDGIAHDLRTPLTRLLAGLERARRRARSIEEYDTAVEEAIAETRATLVTFGALLRIAEVESGTRRAGFTNLDLNAVAADVVDFYEPLAERKRIALSLETARLPSEMPGDPSLMFEALGNLVDNAIKFSPPDSQIILRVVNADETIGLEVRDNGPGIPEDERNLVLRRFHRAERSGHTPGSGLGLSLVAAVAKLHCLNLTIDDGSPGCWIRLWRVAPASVGAEQPGPVDHEGSALGGIRPAL